MTYILEHKDEGQRLEQQSLLPAYSLAEELRNLSVSPNETVLDAGCGTGIVCRYLASHYPQLNIEACDFSEIRLQQAKKQLTTEPLKTQIRFFQSPLDGIRSEDNTYDHVICRYVFEHLLEPKTVASEFLRILKPKGTAHIINFDGILHNLYPMSSELSSFMKKFVEQVPYDLRIGHKIPHILTSCGFENVQWNVSAVKFTGKDLDSEVEMTQQRLDFVMPTLIKVLGSRQDAKRFRDLYCEEMTKEGSTLFYNKFVISGQKPESR